MKFTQDIYPIIFFKEGLHTKVKKGESAKKKRNLNKHVLTVSH